MRGTLHSGDEARLVAEAIDDGVDTLVVAGGDGTWSKCAIPLARAGCPLRMGFLAAGTGNDFARNLAIDASNPSALAKQIADGVGERRVDLGRVDDTWFLNVAGFGFDVAVLQASKRNPRLRGPAVYLMTAVREVLSYPGLSVSMHGAAAKRRLLAVFSNGAYFGGAFHIAPRARIDDGRIDALLVDSISPLKRLPLLARAVRGTHLSSPYCTHESGALFRLGFETPAFFEADGELCLSTGTDVEIASIPGALRVLDV